MQEVTKKHLINKVGHSLELRLGTHQPQTYHVPSVMIKKIVQELAPYEVDDAPSVNWRELLEDVASLEPGDVAHKEGAMMIKGLRAREGMTQAVLAQKLGMRQENLSRLETAKRTISRKMAHKLAAIFKIDYRVFL